MEKLLASNKDIAEVELKKHISDSLQSAMKKTIKPVPRSPETDSEDFDAEDERRKKKEKAKELL